MWRFGDPGVSPRFTLSNITTCTQLAAITFHSASLRYFKWPYHAKVMKTLEIVSRGIVSHGVGGGPFRVLDATIQTNYTIARELLRAPASLPFSE
jgi:hypothetical protein